MENNKKIQYAVAFSVIAILVFQSFSNIILQSVYALSYDTIATPPSGRGSNAAVLTAVRSGDTIFYLGLVNILGQRYNVTAIDANTHAVLMSTGTCGMSVVCAMDGYSQLLACEGCGSDTVFLYSGGGLKKFTSAGLIGNSIPCTGTTTFNTLHSKKYLAINEISSICATDKIWLINPISMAITHITPTLTNMGGLNNCQVLIDGFIDTSNKRVLALCFHTSDSLDYLNLYSYSDSSLSDLTYINQLALPRHYAYIASNSLSYSFVTVTSSSGASEPPLQISVSDDDIYVFHVFPVGSGTVHMSMFIPNPLASGAIGVLWIYNVDDHLMNGFLPHNSTSLGSILCNLSDCNHFQLPLSYYPDDRNFFYSGGWSTGKILIWNSTEETEAIYSIDTTAGNGTGGSGGGNTTGGTTGHTCQLTDPDCTITKQIGGGLCVFRIVDCSDDSNMATNGLGYLLLALAIMVYIGFIWKIVRKRIDSIPTFIWIIGILAIVMAFTVMQIIDPTLVIISIVVIVAFAVMSVKKVTGGVNMFNRGES